MEAAAPPKAFSRAYHLCRKHGLYIVGVPEREDPAVPGEYITAYVVYRQPPAGSPSGTRGVRLGRRRGDSALLAFVKKLTNEP